MEIHNKGEDPKSMENRDYIPWEAEGVEKIPEGEEEDIKAVAKQINDIQKAMYNAHRHAFGGRYHRLYFSPAANL